MTDINDITIEDIAVGDEFRDTETGETLVYRAGRRLGKARFDRYQDGEHVGWRNQTHDEFVADLEDGRLEPIHLKQNDPSLDDTSLDLEAGDTVYIRFGDIPDGERSTNHADDEAEAGVSVYAADVTTTDDGRIQFSPTGQKLQQVLLLATRPTYLVTGTEVGTGTDGEPLLQDVAVHATLKTPSGVGGFILAEDA